MTGSIRLEGFAELDRVLGQLKPSTAKGPLRRVGREALGPFDDKWRELAPHEYGDLEDSGGVGSKLTRSQRQAREREHFVEVFGGPGPHPQAIMDEFGTDPHIIRAFHAGGLRFEGESGGLIRVPVVEHPGAPAQPFVRPAWEATKDDALEIIRRRLGEEILATANRVARRRRL